MAAVDPHTPVLVGAGQLSWTDRNAATTPLALMVEASRRALRDTRRESELLPKLRSIGVVNGLSWPAPDPGRALAAELGASPSETVTTHISGTSPLDMLREAASRVRDGQLDAALIAGAEAVKSTADGRYAGGPDQPEGTEPDVVLGTDRYPREAAQEGAGLLSPVTCYAMFENAVRAAAGRTADAHEAWLGELWARFGMVAKSNPYAWLDTAPEAQSIVDTHPGNRLVASPYRKLMTANLYVDQAAALVLCSAGTAEAAGVPRERWVFPYASAAANDHWYVGQREHLDRSPAIRAVGRAALRHAGLGIDEIGHLDLYSCFPSAVQIAGRELGIDLRDATREPTVTGGLTFAGGPGSNYVTHALAALTHRLREDPHGIGLCTGVGWYLTKHAATVLSATPPDYPFADFDMQSEVDKLPSRAIETGIDVTAPIETYTVSFAQGNVPETGHLSCLLPDGRRAFAATSEPETLGQLLDGDPIGRTVRLSADGTIQL
ncbi:MAG: acetyl-CoA acetyltransferase [Pseudonocardiaceae bacterium]|nr:acetyl-CoA acetyltransferase [Pseudonocardiaceae bacterium]